MLGLRRDHDAVRNTVPENKMRWLGRAGEYEYAVHNNVEYAVDRHASADPGEYVRQRGEILIRRVRREVLGGTEFESHLHHRAWPVASGTYAKKSATVPKPDAEKPMRAWGLLAALPLMQRREPTRVAAGLSASALNALEHLPASSEQEKAVIAGAVDLLDRTRPSGVVEFGGHEPPDRSVAGLIAHYAKQGIEFTRPRGWLKARSRTPIRLADREVIDKAWPLIDAYIAGSPIICCECDKQAIDIAFPSAPVCADHLES